MVEGRWLLGRRVVDWRGCCFPTAQQRHKVRPSRDRSHPFHCNPEELCFTISVTLKNQSVIAQFFQSLVPPALIIFTPFSKLFSEPPSHSCLPSLCPKALCYPNILGCIIFHLNMVDLPRHTLLEKTGLPSHNS